MLIVNAILKPNRLSQSYYSERLKEDYREFFLFITIYLRICWGYHLKSFSLPKYLSHILGNTTFGPGQKFGLKDKCHRVSLEDFEYCITVKSVKKQTKRP